MKKNNCLLITILLLGLTFAPMACAENNLVQLDLKKGNGNAVDVTFFTSENYGGNVIVRKKSDNKYVILMPKILTSGYRSADLGSVHDLITNIDVKSVNDGAAGYTKITVITTKPLNITTHVAKAAPVTEAQKQYRTLIAEAYTVKNNVNKPAPQKPAPQKTQVTVNKSQATTQPAKTSQTPPAKSEVKQPIKQEVKPQKPQIKLTPVDTKSLTSKKPENKIVQKIEEVKENANVNKHMPDVPTVSPTPVQPTVEKIEQPIQDIKDVKDIKKPQSHKHLSLSSIKSKVSTLKGKVLSKMPAGITTTLILTIIPILALIAFIKLIASSLKTSQALKKSFLERISKKPRQKDYEHIINNENLNWQEKYQLFINQSEKDPMTNSQENTTRNIVEKTTDSIEEQRQKLEQLVTPETSKTIDNTPVKSENVKVHQEENAISETLKDSAKIKAFEPTLDEAKRNVKLKKSRFTRFATKEDYEVEKPKAVSPIQHQTNIQLKKSPLTGTARQLANANLKVTDVKKDDYVMSSLDEFFATPQTSVASTLSQIKPSMKMAKPVQKEISNPIENKKSSTEKPTFSGLIVKTGCNIDEDRGFYIVNLDGTSALIGRIKEDIFVLKKFDDTSNRRLQVRHDKENIYMVRADEFKSLVDIENMGVLIEL